MLHSNAPKQAPAFLARHLRSAASHSAVYVWLCEQPVPAQRKKQQVLQSFWQLIRTDCCKYSYVRAMPSTSKEGAGTEQELLLDLCLDLLLGLAPTRSQCWEGVALVAKLLEGGSPFPQNLPGSCPCTAAAEELPVPISTHHRPEAVVVPSAYCHLEYCCSMPSLCLASLRLAEQISVPF